MARQRSGGRPRKNQKRFSEEYAQPPTGDEAAARWKEFIARLDELNQSICMLADMGQTIIEALERTAASTGNPLLDLLGKTRAFFEDARRQYQGGDGRG